MLTINIARWSKAITSPIQLHNLQPVDLCRLWKLSLILHSPNPLALLHLWIKDIPHTKLDGNVVGSWIVKDENKPAAHILYEVWFTMSCRSLGVPMLYIVVARITTKPRIEAPIVRAAEDPSVKAKCTPNEKNESIICLVIANCKPIIQSRKIARRFHSFRFAAVSESVNPNQLRTPWKYRSRYKTHYFSAPRSLIRSKDKRKCEAPLWVGVFQAHILHGQTRTTRMRAIAEQWICS